MTDAHFKILPAAMLSHPERIGAVSTEQARVTHPIKLSVHVSMEALEADWRRIEASYATSLHQTFDWCSAWAKTHENQIVLVRGRINYETVFILPLELVRGRFFSTARFIGSPHSNINTGLFAPDLCPSVLRQLSATLTSDVSDILARVADVVTLEKIPLDWRGVQHPLSSFRAVRNQNASYQLPLLDTFETTLAQINAKRRRKKFRLSERRIQAVGNYEHVVAISKENRQHLLTVFFQQKAKRFKALGLPNVFQDAPTQAFLRTLADVPPTGYDQPLQMNAIRLVDGPHAGRILAVAGLSRKGDHVICQFGSIDEELAADSSPGELLFYLIIQDCCAASARIFDFGIGDQPYKQSWCTVETIQRDVILALTTRGHIAAWIHHATVRTKSAIKQNKQIYGFVQRFRQRRQESASLVASSD